MNLDIIQLASSLTVIGEEACQYHYLKECCKKVGMLNQPSHNSATLVKCRFREVSTTTILTLVSNVISSGVVK